MSPKKLFLTFIFLLPLPFQDLTLQEAETMALSILKQVMEEKVNQFLESSLIPNVHLRAKILCVLCGVRWLLIMLILQGLHQHTICTPHLRLRLSSIAYKSGGLPSSLVIPFLVLQCSNSLRTICWMNLLFVLI